MEEIITQNYPECETIVTDNEGIFISNSSKAVYEKYKITHVTTPIQHSTSNGQVEQAHSTLIELIRCLSKQNNSTSSDEIFNAVKAYNNTIHSVTGGKQINIHRNPDEYPNNHDKIRLNQKKLLEYHNKNRKNRQFEPNEVIFIKSNRRRKDASAYVKHIVILSKTKAILF